MTGDYPSSWNDVKDTNLGWGPKPALVLVDVCTAYWAEGSRLSLNHNPAGKASPESMKRVVAAARRGGVPVIWTTVYFDHCNMADGGVSVIKSPTMDIWKRGDTRGMGDWMPGLIPEPHDFIVKKQYPSAFLGTPLNATLRAMGADTVVVCGVSTSGCCRATTVDAMGYGFRPMLIDEASGDRSKEIQDYTLFDIQSRYGDVVSEQEAVKKFEVGWK